MIWIQGHNTYVQINTGAWPSGKAPGFDPGIRRFESCRPSHFAVMGLNGMIDQSTQMMLFTGNANRALAEKVCHALNIRLGKAMVGRFSDGEVQVEIEENVRGKDVFIIQPFSRPINDHIIELTIMIDALYRASAGRITAVIPYYGYGRQDRRPRSIRVPISAKVIANIISSAFTHRILTVDLHADQVQGFFDIPVDNIYASPVLLADLWHKNYNDVVIISPDVGGVVRARAVAKLLGEVDLAIIDKRRPRPNESRVMNIIGTVQDKTCIIVDDLVDTAGTLCEAAKALKAQGAGKVLAYATHPVLSGDAVKNISNSMLDEVVVTDTIPLSDAAQNCEKIRQISIADLLAESINRINLEESVSSLII